MTGATPNRVPVESLVCRERNEMMSWDAEFDVVCVGSGVGGLTAAAVAADGGASVLLLEKSDLIGGVTARSGGQMWVGGSHLERQLGIDDSTTEVAAYLDGLSQGRGEPDVKDAFVHRSPEAVEFVAEKLGIELEVIRGLPDYYFPMVAGSKAEGRYTEIAPFDASRIGDWASRCVVSPYSDFYSYATFAEILQSKAGEGAPIGDVLAGHRERDERCAGSGLVAALLEACLKRHVEVWTGAAATRLVHDGDALGGITVRTSSGQRQVRARQGVLLATGGYDWNSDFMRSFESLSDTGSMTEPTIEGDHLTLAAEYGAIGVPSRLPSQTPIFIGYEFPGQAVDGHPLHRSWSPGHPHSMIVNRAGHRFADDAFYPDVVAAVGRFVGRTPGSPNWPAWLIFDQNFLDKYGLPPAPIGGPLPDGLGVSSDTIEGLADAAGIDASGLAESVTKMATFAATGVDADFGRGDRPWSRTMIGDRHVTPNPNLAPIDRAPFYAVRMKRVAMGVPTTGLRTDACGRVIDARGSVVPKLHAVGNAAAWLDIGAGTNSGFANTRGMTFGYLSALTMLG
jgi:3-oxosteroid 1-dehydrogenase